MAGYDGLGTLEHGIDKGDDLIGQRVAIRKRCLISGDLGDTAGPRVGLAIKSGYNEFSLETIGGEIGIGLEDADLSRRLV